MAYEKFKDSHFIFCGVRKSLSASKYQLCIKIVWTRFSKPRYGNATYAKSVHDSAHPSFFLSTQFFINSLWSVFVILFSKDNEAALSILQQKSIIWQLDQKCSSKLQKEHMGLNLEIKYLVKPSQSFSETSSSSKQKTNAFTPCL